MSGSKHGLGIALDGPNDKSNTGLWLILSKNIYIPKRCRWDPNDPPSFNWGFCLLYAFAAAFTVSNMYYNQPILHILAQDFSVSFEKASQVATLMQSGYAAGVLFLCPLGDICRRRPLVLFLIFSTADVWLGLCLTTSFDAFRALSFLAALTTVSPQLILPLVADLVPPKNRAVTISTVFSGVGIGMLLARILSGVTTESAPWRTIYFIALGLQYLVLGLLFLFMPDYPSVNPEGKSYLRILQTIITLPFSHPILVQTSLIGFLVSAPFMCFWTTLTFLLASPPFSLSTLNIGLFALVGLPPFLANPFISHYLTNRYHPTFTCIVGLLIGLVGCVVGWCIGAFSLVGPVLQGIMVDLSVIMVQTACRTLLVPVEPKAHNCINTVYMTSCFYGSLAGVAVGNRLYAQGGWRYSGGVSIAFFAAALLVCFVRGPHEEHWLGWRGGWGTKKPPVEAGSENELGGLEQLGVNNNDEPVELQDINVTATDEHARQQPLIQAENTDQAVASPTTENMQNDQVGNMSKAKAFGVWIAIMCGVACPFLDEGIISTAIPQITDQFGSLADVGWYGSAYLMTLCAFQLIFGRLYSGFNIKFVFLSSLAIFETGSVLCAMSQTSTAFIVGRAITGCGGAGLMSGAVALLAAALPAENLPFYIGAMGFVYGVAAAVGPVAGGLITSSYLTWRWCFYINLPFAVPPAIATIFIIKVPPLTGDAARSWLQKIRELDYLGIFLLLPGITVFIMALEFGVDNWNDARTIGCFAAAGTLLLSFMAQQWWMGERALVPLRIMKTRVVLFGSTFTFCLESAFLVLAYYIPLWLQTIQGVSAAGSGVRYLAFCISFILSIFTAGWLVTKFGYFQPFMLSGTVLVSLGSGLLSTLTVSSGAGMWISYQAIAGLGIGASTEQASVAVQRLLDEDDAPIGLAVVLFCQNLGPTTFISVAHSVLLHKLTMDIRKRLPGIDPREILHSGATELRRLVDAADVPVLLDIYNSALTRTFVVAAVMAAASVVGLVGIGLQKIPTGDNGTAVHHGTKGRDEESGLGSNTGGMNGNEI